MKESRSAIFENFPSVPTIWAPVGLTIYVKTQSLLKKRSHKKWLREALIVVSCLKIPYLNTFDTLMVVENYQVCFPWHFHAAISSFECKSIVPNNKYMQIISFSVFIKITWLFQVFKLFPDTNFIPWLLSKSIYDRKIIKTIDIAIFLFEWLCHIITKNLWKFEANISNLNQKRFYRQFNFLSIQQGFHHEMAVFFRKETIFSEVCIIPPWKLARMLQIDYHEK